MRLALRQPDGSTLRDHLQAAAHATGRPDEQLLDRVPAEGSALWHAFVELSAARPVGWCAADQYSPEATSRR